MIPACVQVYLWLGSGVMAVNGLDGLESVLQINQII